MNKNNFKKVALSFLIIGFCGGAWGETFPLTDHSPKHESKLTSEQVYDIETQVRPTMTEYEKLGDFYLLDEMNRNAKKAYEYYRTAENEGSNYGKYMRGKMILNGHGVDKNMSEARNILKRVSSPYEGFASRLLAESYMETNEMYEAMSFMEKVKTPESRYQLAKKAHEKNRDGLAIEMYESNASDGHVKSHVELGKIYLRSSHLDTDKAIKHLTKGAENGYEEAQYLLGNLYFNGNEQMYANHKKGIEWLLIAGQNGNIDALRKAYWILNNSDNDNNFDIEANNDLKDKLYDLLNEKK